MRDADRFNRLYPGLLAVSVLLLGSMLWLAHLAGAFAEGRGVFDNILFGAALALAILLAIGFALVGRMILDRKGLSSLVFVRPVASIETTANESFEARTASVLERLTREGFSIEKEADDDNQLILKLRKKKAAFFYRQALRRSDTLLLARIKSQKTGAKRGGFSWVPSESRSH